jgi:hypothetical protein
MFIYKTANYSLFGVYTPCLAKMSVLYLSLGYNKAYIRLFTVGTHLFTNYVNISLKCLKILLKFLKPCVYI